MSFGRPPSLSSNFQVSPPERGSFPLDHEGECKKAMQDYLRCMKENKNDNGKCRTLSKKYLECRMDRGLMERDNMDNLGFKDLNDESAQQSSSSSASTSSPAASSPPAGAGAGAGAGGSDGRRI